MIPRSAVANAPEIWRVPGCLGVRVVYDDWHAVIEGAPDTVQRLLSEAFGPYPYTCSRAPLEEVFVELVSGGRERVMS
jgi:hypothetical protein